MKHLLTITDKDITGTDGLSNAKPRIAVGVILFDEDGNIALYYANNWEIYTVPGGGVDDGEDILLAAKREMWEETGCQCEIIAEIGVIHENRSEHNFTQERYHFLARIVGDKGPLHLTEKESASGATVRWFPLDEAIQIISNQKPSTYQQCFIQKRDVVVLQAVATLME